MSGHFLCTWTNITAPKITARGKPPMISSFFFLFFFFDNCESLGQFEVNYRRKSPFKKKIIIVDSRERLPFFIWGSLCLKQQSFILLYYSLQIYEAEWRCRQLRQKRGLLLLLTAPLLPTKPIYFWWSRFSSAISLVIYTLLNFFLYDILVSEISWLGIWINIF